jgi:N6-L-threonylcarbamoyladenine synthase
MKILAVETSCDETAVSVLEAKGGVKNPVFDILSDIVASQVKVHAPWGGVVPNLAKREHQKNLPIILRRALKGADLSPKNPDVDLMAVTSGPGLEPALWVGISFAQDLARKWGKPLIGINHLEGHITSVLLK